LSSKTIRVEGVAKRFRRGSVETHALEAIDLQVGSGEFVAVVGPSGCGKSTLMRLVAGLIPPSAGQIRFDDEIVREPRKDTGIVFQKANLVEWRNALDNVLLQVELRSLPVGEYRERARALLASLGLADFLDRHPYELSGGMQQRTAIARALANDPKILLLDEPFGALDNQTRALMQEMLLGIWERERKTVIFVTHDVEEAIFMASRVVVMSARPGRIKADIAVDLPHPRPYTIKTSAAFVALKERLVEEIRAEVMGTL
jgi:NitT/TauT family transport system ATP-binding protein